MLSGERQQCLVGALLRVKPVRSELAVVEVGFVIWSWTNAPD